MIVEAADVEPAIDPGRRFHGLLREILVHLQTPIEVLSDYTRRLWWMQLQEMVETREDASSGTKTEAHLSRTGCLTEYRDVPVTRSGGQGGDDGLVLGSLARTTTTALMAAAAAAALMAAPTIVMAVLTIVRAALTVVRTAPTMVMTATVTVVATPRTIRRTAARGRSGGGHADDVSDRHVGALRRTFADAPQKESQTPRAIYLQSERNWIVNDLERKGYNLGRFCVAQNIPARAGTVVVWLGADWGYAKIWPQMTNYWGALDELWGGEHAGEGGVGVLRRSDEVPVKLSESSFLSEPPIHNDNPPVAPPHDDPFRLRPHSYFAAASLPSAPVIHSLLPPSIDFRWRLQILGPSPVPSPAPRSSLTPTAVLPTLPVLSGELSNYRHARRTSPCLEHAEASTRRHRPVPVLKRPWMQLQLHTSRGVSSAGVPSFRPISQAKPGLEPVRVNPI
ncbi:hypothetical protein DFH09DRAFT_1095093 [Mycena vulgaris]|nr:hypothetical protein DFH09DRAFT_1095093 [Mycena vulgaris]